MTIYGKKVLITGGNGAIGRAIADCLSRQGASIIVFDQIHAEGTNDIVVDVCSEEEVIEAISSIGGIDILINCAGEIYSEPCVNVLNKQVHKRNNWDRVISNNLTSCFNVSVHAASKMIQSRTKGVIINFSSISAQGNAGQVAYSAAKAGVEALTKTMAKELGLFKIRCVAIAPGFIDTQSTHNALQQTTIDYYKKNTPLRMLGNIANIISTVEFVIENEFITGCVIPVDGGLNI